MSQLPNETVFRRGSEMVVPTAASANQPCATARAFQTDELPDGTATILFVEDEEFVQKVAGEVLQSAGYRVLKANRADKALRIYDEQGGDVNLLLTDVILPDENGRVLAKRLRLENPQLRVLFTTGYSEQMTFPEKVNYAEKCLPKPFSAAMLLRTVREVLEEPTINGRLSFPARHSCSSE